MFDYIKRQHGLSSSRYPKRRTQKSWFRLQPANCSLYIKCVNKERNWSLCWSASVFVSLTISHSSQTKTHQPNSTIAVSRKYEPETECGWDDAAFKAKTYFWISCGCVFSLFFAVSEAGQSIISAGAAAVSHLKRKSAQAQRLQSTRCQMSFIVHMVSLLELSVSGECILVSSISPEL